MDRIIQLGEFYDLLHQAERKFSLRPLKDLSRGKLPAQVVYYFFDEQQKRENGRDLKVVRVGTHAARRDSNAIAYTRLNQHRGTLKGYGNHRGSVFRELVGFGLLGRDRDISETWGRKKSRCPEELDIEAAVSKYLSNLLFTVIEVRGPSSKDNERAFVEKNSIALLSNFCRPSIDQPNELWLRHSTGRQRVAQSGLWNSDYVDYSSPHALFIPTLESCVRKMKNWK